MQKKKVKWSKPKLIILMRGRPEEAVLGICACGSKSTNSAQVHHECYQSCHSCFDACSS